jgi:MFS transporter, DHA1 family, tetracycline resistance protein
MASSAGVVVPDVAGPKLSVLFGAMFTLAAANSVVFPLLGDLQDAYGLPTWGLGLLSATAFGVGLLVQLTVAGMADRGHAKALLLAGLGVAVAGGLLFAVGTSLPVFVVARGLGGVSVGLFVPAARAIAATVDRTRVAQNLGRLAGFELAGFVTGPVVAAALADPLGLKAPFVFFAGVAAVAFAQLLPRRLPELPSSAASSRPSLSLLADRGVVVACLLALALFLPVGIYDSLWAKYLGERGASTLFIGISLTMYGVPFALLASRGGRLADRTGPVRAALLALIVVAPMTAMYGVLRVPVLILLVALVEATVQAVAVPAAQAAMAQACPPDRVAAGQGLAGAVQLAGAAMTALVAAPIYEALGPEAVFGLAAIAIAIIGSIAAVLARRGASTEVHNGTSATSEISPPTPNAAR